VGLLARALHTALGQTGVDEASEDGTAAFLERLADPRVRVVRHERPRGVASARNAGLARARSPWVAFLDDDDLWAPGKLALQLAAAERAGAGWVCVGEVIVDEQLRIVSGKRPPVGRDLDQLLAYNVIPGGGSGAMVRTDVARSLGGFDPGLSILADWDMWIRLWLTEPPAAVMEPLVGYLRHQRSMSTLNAGFARELDHVVRKHDTVRRALGVEMNRARWARWEAQMHVRSRNRLRAVRTYVQLVRRYHDRRSLARAVCGGLAPSLMVEIWRRRSQRRVPPDLYREANAWLAPLRATSFGTRAGRSVARPDRDRALALSESAPVA
jgi:hypothetical protein